MWCTHIKRPKKQPGPPHYFFHPTYLYTKDWQEIVAFSDSVLFLSGPEEQRKGHSPSGKSSWVVWSLPDSTTHHRMTEGFHQKWEYDCSWEPRSPIWLQKNHNGVHVFGAPRWFLIVCDAVRLFHGPFWARSLSTCTFLTQSNGRHIEVAQCHAVVWGGSFVSDQHWCTESSWSHFEFQSQLLREWMQNRNMGLWEETSDRRLSEWSKIQ